MSFPPAKKKELVALYETLMTTEATYWESPEVALSEDWFEAYWNLHNKVLQFMNQETCDAPLHAKRELDNLK